MIDWYTHLKIKAVEEAHVDLDVLRELTFLVPSFKKH